MGDQGAADSVAAGLSPHLSGRQGADPSALSPCGTSPRSRSSKAGAALLQEPAAADRMPHSLLADVEALKKESRRALEQSFLSWELLLQASCGAQSIEYAGGVPLVGPTLGTSVGAIAVPESSQPRKVGRQDSGSSSSHVGQLAASWFEASPRKREEKVDARHATHSDVQVQDLLHNIELEFGEGSLQTRVARVCAKGVEWWTHLKEPERVGPAAAIVNSMWFELATSFAILAYCVVLIGSTDYAAQHISHLGAGWTDDWESSFFVVFLVEFAMRFYVHRLFFLCNDEMGWNLLDFVVLCVQFYDIVLPLVVDNHPTEAKLVCLRVVRFLKAGKALRVLKMLRLFSELRFMINSVTGSLVSLFWCSVMLAVVICLFSLTFVRGVIMYVATHHSDVPDEQLAALLQYFGSVGACMMTCFRCVTGGDDWGPFYDILKPSGVVNCIVFYFFIVFSEVALFNIVTGVFIEHAMKLGQPEINAYLFEQRRQNLADAQALRDVFAALDVDHSGTISAEEFDERFQHNEEIKARLAVMGLSIRDAAQFFKMLVGGRRGMEVDLDFFVDCCLKMKGGASSVDVQSLAFEVNLIQQYLQSFGEEMRLRVGPPRADAGEAASRSRTPSAFARRGAPRGGGHASASGDTVVAMSSWSAIGKE